MEENIPEFNLPPLAFMAFAYAAFSIVALLVLPSLEAPLNAYEAESHIVVFLGRTLGDSVLWGLGVGALITVFSQAASKFTSWGRRLSDVIQEMMGKPSLYDALILAALSGLAEELIFRGLLLPYMGLAASSIIFGLVHLIPKDDLWPWSLWAVAAGFFLGWLALHTGGLLAPILAHSMVNAVGFIMLPGDPSENSSKDSMKDSN